MKKTPHHCHHWQIPTHATARPLLLLAAAVRLVYLLIRLVQSSSSTVAPFGSGESLSSYAIESSFSGSPLAVSGIGSCCSPALNDMFFVMAKHFDKCHNMFVAQPRDMLGEVPFPGT